MKHIDEILEELRHVDVFIRCRKCGAVPMLVGKQYTVRCHRCGTYIQVEKNFLAMLKIDEYRAKYGQSWEPRYKCATCRDTGMVFIDKQINANLYSYAYRCNCPAGIGRTDLGGWPVVPAEFLEPVVPEEVQVVRGEGNPFEDGDDIPF